MAHWVDDVFWAHASGYGWVGPWFGRASPGLVDLMSRVSGDWPTRSCNVRGAANLYAGSQSGARMNA